MPTDQAAKCSDISIALVSMPWSIYNRPSIQLGALKSYLQQQDPALKVGCFHHYLKVARTITPEKYHWLTLSGWAGEALYSSLLFPEMISDAATLFESERKKFGRDKVREDFESLSQMVQHTLIEWVNSIKWEQYELVGFSVCFNQLLPSLAAAYVIKEKAPSVKIVFGGSACGGQGGEDLQRNFNQVDHVIRGEGEKGLLDLIRSIKNPLGESADAVIDCIDNCDLKKLPAPDYRDYFHELSSTFGDMPLSPVVPLEFSRGCWWGKCAFCNLNLQWSGYRFKTAEHMFYEIEKIVECYSCLDFSFADNVLPIGEAKKFFRKTAAAQKDYNFFAEIRATQANDLGLYKSGGVSVVQAGIESLSTGLLNKMNKGINAIENIAVMKAAQSEGVRLEGNLITEFPGSTEREVQETLDCLDYVLPFQPLTTAAFFLGLDSPVDISPTKYSIHSSGPHKNYFHLYPAEILRDQEMLIKDHRGSKAFQKKIWRPVVKRIREWQDFHENRKSAFRLPLSYRDGGDFILIRQELKNGVILNHKLRGLSRKIYLYCEEVCDLEMIKKHFPRVNSDDLLKFLDEMVKKKLMYRDASSFLSLAIHNRK